MDIGYNSIKRNRKYIKDILIILIILLIYSSIPHKNQITMNAKYQFELIDNLKEIYDEPEKITKIKVKPMLGDVKLYLYSGRKLVKETLISEEDEIFWYVLDHQYDININIYYIVYSIILIVVVIKM